MVVGVSKSTFSGSCNRCSQRRYENDILWVLLEDVLDAFLYDPCHFIC
jgi:hypothetical protein